MALVDKALARIKELPVAQAAARRLHVVRAKIAEPPRPVILLRVDLTEAKNRLRDRDRAAMAEANLSVCPLDAESTPRVLEMLEREAPQRAASVRLRALQRMAGFVLERSGAPIGYVFWSRGATDPRRLTHPDLRWLPMRPSAEEVYVFDYFMADRGLGLGNLFVRAVQDQHAAMGFSGAYGYVYASNRAALWLYRTTGWVEIGRIVERLYLSRVSLVGDDVFWVNWRRPSSRAHLGRVPGLSRWTT